MYVSHALECNYNCEDFRYIIDLLMIASATCMYYYTLYMYVHVLSSHAHTVYMYSVWNVERSWPGFKNKGREREMAEKHAVSRPGCISKDQELVRQVSEGQSTMIIDALHKALSSSILSSHRLQVCKATSYA